jgi:hypothetical protein
MKKTVDEKLNEVLDIDSDLKEKSKQIIIKPSRDKNIETDYNYARENLYNLVERGQDALDGILELSREMENPRAYEVAGQILKTTSEIAEKLLDLQNKMKKLEDSDESKKSETHNHLYVGSTSELQKFLKKNKD